MLSNETIPMIDFHLFFNGTDEDQKRIGLEIHDACTKTGFFYLFNHGIDQTLIDDVYQQSERFFNQTMNEKMKIFIGSSPYGNNRGYTPMFEEKLSLKGDLKEAFDLALELSENDEDRIQYSAHLLYGPNVWPENLPGFRECIYDQFFLKMKSLGYFILQAFSLSLGFHKNYFQEMFIKPMVTMRLLSYPSQMFVEDENQLGCGEHTDYECFTILSQSNHQSALQILNKNHQWIDIPPIEKTFIINIGDLMQRWTNNRYQSTIHRVINRNQTKRYSIAMFFGPNFSTEICPLIQNENDSSKYSPILAGHYLIQRFNQTYQYRQQDKKRFQ